VKLRFEDVDGVEMATTRDRVNKQPTLELTIRGGSLYIAPSGAGVAREVLELLRPGAGGWR
jgi:hypothetical protein